MTFIEALDSRIDSDLYRDVGPDGRVTMLKEVQRQFDAEAPPAAGGR